MSEQQLKNKVRVVCAASKNAEGDVIASVRHHDMVFHRVVKSLSLEKQAVWKDHGNIVQGFLLSDGSFCTREEAMIIAKQNGQLIREPYGKGTELYSENLY